MIKDLLISALEELGYVNGKTIFLQGSLGQNDPYPDSFFTFWNNDTDYKAFRDNKPTITEWEFTLNFYSNNPFLVNTELERAKPYLKQKGFIIVGKGADANSDEPTHTGRAITLYYIEKEEEK